MYITSNDPYRKERTTDIYVTGDARIFFMNLTRGDDEPESMFWPMSFDIGARIRPTTNHRLSFVYETRAFNRISDRSIDTFLAAPTGNIATRSAYFLYDDLPYNSYVQAGFYRPLFGLYNPNHFTLFADYTGLNQNSVFKGFGAGMAPNVPFFIFNWLGEGDNKSQDFAEEEGFVITAGLRGVTMGWSLVGSYLSTVNRRSNNRKLMVDWNAGGQFGRFTVNGDFVRVDKTHS